MDTLIKRARQLGIVMSTEDAKAADELGDVLDDLWTVLKAVSFQVGRALTPELTDLVKWLAESASLVIDFVKKNKQLVILFAEVGLGLVAVGAAIVGLGVGLLIIAEIIEGVIAFIGVITFLLSPMGLVTVAAVAFGAALAVATVGLVLLLNHLGVLQPAIQAVKDAVAQLTTTFAGVGEIATSSIGGIVAALQSGDLPLAMDIAVKGMRAAWLEGLRAMATDFRDFTKGIFDAIKAIRIEWNNLSGMLGWLFAKATGQPELAREIANMTRDENTAIASGAFDQWASQVGVDLEAAKQELQRSLMAAEMQRNFGNLVPGMPLGAGLPELPDPSVIDKAARELDVGGQFGAAGIGMMGFGSSLAEEAAKAAKETAKNTARTNQILERGRKVTA